MKSAPAAPLDTAQQSLSNRKPFFDNRKPDDIATAHEQATGDQPKFRWNPPIQGRN
jgi:hypothetical protein